MHPKGLCKCRHCGEFFKSDARNRTRQRYCRRTTCRRASKAASQRQWLQREGNGDYFRGPANVERVQQWRQAHPGYWRRPRQKSGTLQDSLIAQPAQPQREANQDEASTLQDLLDAQSPVLVGLIAHLSGSTLQEDIARMTRRLHSRGRAVLGTDVPRPDYGKTPHRTGSGAARAAPV